MTPIPATITVNFDAQTIGTHRVCYRIGNSGSYTCVETECTSIGACSKVLNIYVDNETCSAVTYNGYVQATCNDIASTQGRVPWSTTFTPVPTCKSYNVICNALGIDSVIIDDGGSGYTSAPIVTFAGGGGNATAVAIVGLGAITSIDIYTAGSGYNDGTYAAVPLTGGSGTGATADVIVSGGVVTSIVLNLTGIGYLRSDVLGVDAAAMGGSTPTIPAVFTIESNYRKVTAITSITNIVPFSSVPTVILTGGGGTSAAATAVLEECPTFSSVGCAGDDITVPAGLLGVGDSLTVCDYSTPSVPAAYGVSESGNCLCSCATTTIGVSGTNGSQVQYVYNKCNGAPAIGILTVGGSPSSIVDCVVPGSVGFVSLSGGAVGTVSYGASCS